MTVCTGVGGNGWMYDSLYRCWGNIQYIQVRGKMAVCMTVCTGVGETAICMTVCTGVGGNGCKYVW